MSSEPLKGKWDIKAWEERYNQRKVFKGNMGMVYDIRSAVEWLIEMINNHDWEPYIIRKEIVVGYVNEAFEDVMKK